MFAEIPRRVTVEQRHEPFFFLLPVDAVLQLLGQRGEQGRDGNENGDAPFSNQVRDVAVLVRIDVGGPGGQGQELAHGHPERMMRRQDVTQNVGPRDVDLLHRALDIRDQVPVGQLHLAWIARRAGGTENHGCIIQTSLLRDSLQSSRIRHVGPAQGLISHHHHAQLVCISKLGQFVSGVLIAVVIGQYQAASIRGLQMGDHTLRPAVRVDQDRDRPGENRTPEGDIPIGPILADQGDLLATIEARFMEQPGRKSARPLLQLTECQGLMAVGPYDLHADLVCRGHAGQRLVEQVNQVAMLQGGLHAFLAPTEWGIDPCVTDSKTSYPPDVKSRGAYGRPRLLLPPALDYAYGHVPPGAVGQADDTTDAVVHGHTMRLSQGETVEVERVGGCVAKISVEEPAAMLLSGFGGLASKRRRCFDQFNPR